MDTFNNIKITLTEQNLQYFTHEQKADHLFKVALYGLDNIPAEKIKFELIGHGYKCTEFKTVTKKYDRFTDYIYIV